MVLLKGLNQKGFVFYTNLNSPKSNDLKKNPKAEMCFHWKSLQRQIRIFGSIVQVDDKEADTYFSSRRYESRIGAWASDQSKVMKTREEFLKKVDEYTKNVWYKAATVFCYPSLMEGFGLPVLEAMSHETPVVTSSSTATAEVVQDTGLTVDPRSPEAIAEAITKLLDDFELAEGLATKASLRAEKFTWQNTALKTVEIYREVLN